MSGTEGLLSSKYCSASQSVHKKGSKLISGHNDPQFLRQLPSSQRDLRPALVQIMVSPLAGHAVKLLVSPHIRDNKAAARLIQTLVDIVTSLQHANLLASEGCAEAGVAIQPDEPEQPGEPLRKDSDFHKIQRGFSRYYHLTLRPQLLEAKAANPGKICFGGHVSRWLSLVSSPGGTLPFLRIQ